MSTEELYATTDAAVWAREFCRVHRNSGHGSIDEGWVIGWFANALETGRTHGAAKGQAFKDYVHGRLDAAGVDTHPNGPHSAEGCRVGDRLDIALAPLASDYIPPMHVAHNFMRSNPLTSADMLAEIQKA